MIFDAKINSVNESEAIELLENATDRFEYETIAEATAIVVAEHEANWTKFMSGVGMSELASVMEGQEVIYEGARLKSFIDKAKAYFKMALSKLAEITKSFIAKFDQIFRSNDAFVKKYEKQIKEAKLPSDFSFKGYNFNDSALDSTPNYQNDKAPTSVSNADSINKDDYTKEKAEELLCKESGETFGDKLTNKFYGGKEKVDIKSPDMNKQIQILKSTKDLKGKAKKSYADAHKAIKEIIKKLEKAEKEAIKSKDDLTSASKMESAVSTLLSYWKAYSSAVIMYHGKYMGALGARNRQAKALCTKAITAGLKAKGKADRAKLNPKKPVGEGFVDTDAFLGAVEFI